MPPHYIVYEHYTTISAKGDRNYLFCKTLKKIEFKPPNDLFFRIHHSYLVNLHCITALNKKLNEVEPDNRLMLPISRTHKSALYKIREA